MQKEDKITLLCKVVSQIINENQLLEMDEAELGKILEDKEKPKKKEEDSKESCLAGIIEEEMNNKMKDRQVEETSKKCYKSVLNDYFWKNEIGRMPVSALSDTGIRKFIVQAEETYRMNRRNMICFMGLLQVGLDRIAKDGMADLVYDRYMFMNYIGLEKGIRYIDNPYTEEEISKIREWIGLHPYDIRGMALGLWFLGNISLVQIASLKRKDYHEDLLKKSEKDRLVAKALELQPKDGEYVFMVEKNGIWKKLTAKGLQTKLYYVCEDLGIHYKKIHRNEAVV